MEEKIMNMLEQLYIEVKGVKSELTTTNKRLNSMEGDIKALKQGQEHLEGDIKTLKQGQEHLEGDIKTLKQGQERIEGDIKTLKQGQERIENKLDDMEVQNANRHVELNGKIESLSKDITFVQAVTGKNMTDIANLKLVK